jgi:Tfp pilus assembly protein PilF
MAEIEKVRDVSPNVWCHATLRKRGRQCILSAESRSETVCSDNVSSMPSPRLTTIIALTAVASCVTYFAIGLYVHKHADEALRRAVVRLKNGEHADARSDLSWLLWFQPDNSEALHLTGLSYLDEQNLSAGIKHLERVAANSAVYQDARINLAVGLMSDQQWERARSVLEEFLSRHRDSLIARRLLSGMLLTELRRRDGVQILTDYLRLPSSEAFPFSDRLTLLLDLLIAEFSPPSEIECQSKLEEVDRKRPSQLTVRLALGRCYWKLGRMDDAETLLRDAVQRQPLDPRTRLIRSGFFLDQNDFEAAEHALLRGDLDRAADESSLLLERNDRYHELLCRIAELRGDYSQALHEIEQALIIQPHNREYEARRARLLQRLQRADDAKEAYERSHTLGQSELELWHLSQKLGGRVPTTEQCTQVAELYESLGKMLQAAAWRQLAEQIDRQPMQQSAA